MFTGRGGGQHGPSPPSPVRFTHNALMNTHNALMKTMAHCESRARYTEVPDQAISDCKGIRKPEHNGFAGFRPRRIDSRHRLVHWIASDAQSVHGVSCRYHYGA